MLLTFLPRNKLLNSSILLIETEEYGIHSIQRHPELDFYSAGNQLTLSCVSQQQNVIGSWFQLADNGNLVVNIPDTSIRLGEGNVSLLFSNLTKGDTGFYVCRLTSGVNGLIVEERSVEIVVYEDSTDKVPSRLTQPDISYGDTWIVVSWAEPDSPIP